MSKTEKSIRKKQKKIYTPPSSERQTARAEIENGLEEWDERDTASTATSRKGMR